MMRTPRGQTGIHVFRHTSHLTVSLKHPAKCHPIPLHFQASRGIMHAKPDEIPRKPVPISCHSYAPFDSQFSSPVVSSCAPSRIEEKREKHKPLPAACCCASGGDQNECTQGGIPSNITFTMKRNENRGDWEAERHEDCVLYRERWASPTRPVVRAWMVAVEKNNSDESGAADRRDRFVSFFLFLHLFFFSFCSLFS